MEFCHEMSSGAANVFWPKVVVGQPMGWWAVLKECPQRAKKCCEALGVKGRNLIESVRYKRKR